MASPVWNHSRWTDKIAEYLDSFGDGATIDFVHLCALIRCWAAVGANPHEAAMTERLLAFRTPDGGFNAIPNAETATAYGNFLALAATQDLGIDLRAPHMLAATCRALQTRDGAFANESGMTMGTTPAVAAAEGVLRTVDGKAPPEAGKWLLEKSFGAGGFFAAPIAPMPDLLSTAVALHALAGMGFDLAPIKEDCLDYVDSLWVNKGAFYGNWGDDHLDLEYTFYGLLALGHLSV